MKTVMYTTTGSLEHASLLLFGDKVSEDINELRIFRIHCGLSLQDAVRLHLF